MNVVRDDDADLAARFASGEAEATRALYRAYGRLVYAVAFKVLGDPALAEDATQQAFLQAWRAADRFDPGRPIGPWLVSIGRRAAIDVYRREKRHRAVSMDDAVELVPAVLPPSADQISDVWEVRRALDRLPDNDRELLRLQHFDDLSHSEIAVRLDIPVGTVKSRTHRAHRRLLDLLAHLRPQEVQA
ncbi:MAG: sigma-70 family RNA polymerase sigma factor [Nocardioidaceae bacterium]|nr:sigma-70 family RNA polymerase sigma factor [Nocardioidaceae bacterium]